MRFASLLGEHPQRADHVRCARCKVKGWAGKEGSIATFLNGSNNQHVADATAFCGRIAYSPAGMRTSRPAFRLARYLHELHMWTMWAKSTTYHISVLNGF
jgi:hypothetical protein